MSADTPSRVSPAAPRAMKCEFCFHYPSYTAAPGVACQRCLRVGVGDARSDSRPLAARGNLEAQEELLSIVPRISEPYGLPDMAMVERILAVFGFNVWEVQ